MTDGPRSTPASEPPAPPLTRTTAHDYGDAGQLPLWLFADARQAQAILRELSGWIEQVILRYYRAAITLRPCWYRHPEVVQELIVLHALWRTAFTGPTDAVAAAEWHGQWLPTAVDRMGRALQACSGREHRPHQNDYQRPPADAVDRYSQWWGQTHGTAGIPEPQ